jgi:hypothetical protein
MINKSKRYSREERGAIVGDDGQILDLLEDLKTQPASTFRRTLSQARANERIANGNLVNDNIIRNSLTTGYNEQDLPRAPQAILNNLVLTWSALLCKDRQSVYAVPTRNDLQTVSASEIATKIIEHTETEEDIANKWHQTATFAAYHGTAFMYITFDPESRRVRWRPLSVFDCYIDDKDDPAKIDYCVIREYIDPYTAEEMITAVDPEYTGTPETETYQDGQGYDHEGVAKWTIWYKPSARYPTGLYACVIADKVVESTEYPYVFPDKEGTGTVALLPISWWYCRKNRGTSLGLTWASDVAPLQIALNELNSKLLRNAQTAQSYLVVPKALQMNEGLDPIGQIIAADPGSDMGAISWVSPAPLDPNQIQEKQNLIQSMYDSAGISQATAGQSSGASGRALAYQAELDTQKHADAFKSFEIAIKNAWELDLKLKQQFYTVPQRVMLDDRSEIVFVGTDIAGVDVRLESRSAREGQAAVKAERSMAAIGAGLAPPESLADVQPTSIGLVSATIADDLIDRYLAGEEVSITAETVEPTAFAAALDRRIRTALLQRDIGTAEALQALRAQYMRDMALAAAPQEAASGPPPSAPEQPLPESITAEGVTGTVQ